MKKHLLLFALTIGLLNAQQQQNNVLKELEHIHAAFSKGAVWAKVDIRGYKTASDTKGFLAGSGEFRFIPDIGYYSNFDNEICMSDASKTLYIDKDRKVVGVFNEGLKKIKKQNANLEELNASIATADSAAMTKDEAMGRGKIIIFTKQSGIAKTEVFYDLKSYSISKVVYYYSSSAENNFDVEKIILNYSYSDVSKLTGDFFKTERIVHHKKIGEMISEGEYKNYKVVKVN